MITLSFCRSCFGYQLLLLDSIPSADYDLWNGLVLGYLKDHLHPYYAFPYTSDIALYNIAFWVHQASTGNRAFSVVMPTLVECSPDRGAIGSLSSCCVKYLAFLSHSLGGWLWVVKAGGYCHWSDSSGYQPGICRSHTRERMVLGTFCTQML